MRGIQMNFDKILDKLEKTATYTKEGKVGDFRFSMRVLSFSEELRLANILDEITEEEDYSSLNDWKKYVIATSIYALEGEVLPAIIETDNGERVEKSVYLKDKFESLPSSIIEALFSVYTDLKEESEKAIEEGLEYNWFKDPEVRKKEEEKRAAEARDLRQKEIERLSSLAEIAKAKEESEKDEEYEGNNSEDHQEENLVEKRSEEVKLVRVDS
jgi:hypothetical protein